jgi:hypothetical protein
MSQNAASTSRPPINAANSVPINPILRHGSEKDNGR